MGKNEALEKLSDVKTICYLVTDGDEVDQLATDFEEYFDETDSIQARLSVTDCTTHQAHDAVLRSAKVGSRWGKDLDDVYRDAVDSLLSKVDDANAAEKLVDWYENYNADAYEAELTSEAVSIGFDVPEAIRDQFDNWTTLDFNRNDLAAAVGIAKSSAEWECSGYILLETREPLSDQRDRGSLGQLVQVIQQLRLLDFRVAIVAPRGKTDEVEVVESIFQPLGSSAVIDRTDSSIEITEEVKTFVDQWYGRLCYDVYGKKTPKRVVQPASVTLYDLPQDELAQHFVRAIDEGLQGKYSENTFKEDTFLELWNERVTNHQNYYKYKSRYNEFPKVQVARRDGIVREFELHHEGPQVRPYLNRVQIPSAEPEEKLVDLIVRFLDAELVGEERWEALVDSARERVADSVTVDSETLVADVLLHRKRKRADLPPLISDQVRTTSISENAESGYEEGWYEKHWPTILSGYEISSPTGTKIIEKKKQLMRSLDGDSVADSVLYHKLERDVENAWETYLDSIEKGVEQNIPEEFDLNTETNEMANGHQIVFTVSTPHNQEIETEVDIYLPYADVRVNNARVSKATVTNTVGDILDTFEGVLYDRTRDTVGDSGDATTLLYNIVKFYIDVTDCEPGDRIYFDDLIEFCRYLPGIWRQFKEPTQTIDESLRESFGNKELINKLREDGVKFHRKGSDDHGSIRTPQNRYTAFDVADRLIR